MSGCIRIFCFTLIFAHLVQAAGAFAAVEPVSAAAGGRDAAAAELQARIAALYPVCVDGLCGYVNAGGEVAIPPRFEYAGNFDASGLAEAKKDGKYGFINTRGEWVLKPVYDYIRRGFAANGTAIVEKNKKYGAIDKGGRWVIRPEFAALSAFDAMNTAIAQSADTQKYGLLDSAGNWVFPPKFDRLEAFDAHGFARAQEGKNWGFVGRDGQWRIPPAYKDLADFDEDGLASMWVKGLYGCINRKGETIVPPVSSKPVSFRGGELARILYEGEYGFINRQGKWAIEPRFYWADDFGKNDLAVAKHRFKYGLIDKSGAWVLPEEYDEIHAFDGRGLAIAQKNGKYGVLAKNGKWHIAPRYKYLTREHDALWNGNTGEIREYRSDGGELLFTVETLCDREFLKSPGGSVLWGGTTQARACEEKREKERQLAEKKRREEEAEREAERRRIARAQPWYGWEAPDGHLNVNCSRLNNVSARKYCETRNCEHFTWDKNVALYPLCRGQLHVLFSSDVPKWYQDIQGFLTHGHIGSGLANHAEKGFNLAHYTLLKLRGAPRQVKLDYILYMLTGTAFY